MCLVFMVLCGSRQRHGCCQHWVQERCAELERRLEESEAEREREEEAAHAAPAQAPSAKLMASYRVRLCRRRAGPGCL